MALLAYWRYIAGAAILAALVAGYFAWHHHVYAQGETHIQAQWDADKAVRAAILAKAQADIITAQKARDAVVQQAEVDHAKLVQDNQRHTSDLLGRVRDLETALHASAMLGSMDNPAKPGGTTTVPGGDAELESEIERFNAAVKQASDAGYHDSAELAAILAIAPH